MLEFPEELLMLMVAVWGIVVMILFTEFTMTIVVILHHKSIGFLERVFEPLSSSFELIDEDFHLILKDFINMVIY
jgi:hypothetical protein